MELTKKEIKLIIDTFEHHESNLESEWSVELGTKEKTFLKKLKEAINYTRCCTELKGKEVMTFDEWFKVHGYYHDNSMWLKNSSVNGLPNILDKYNEYRKLNL